MNKSDSNTSESIPIIIRTSAPSYIKNISRCDDDVLLIYRNINEEAEKFSPIVTEDTNVSLDLTGNPLEVDLSAGDCTLNTSYNCAMNLWNAAEDKYGSFDLKTVRKAINSELAKRRLQDNLYIYGLVDGKTKDKLVVLGAQQTNKTLSRTQIFIDDIFMVDDQVNQKLEIMRKEHLKNTSGSNEHETKISHIIRGTYVLYGHKISVYTPMLLNSKFSGSVSCDVTWSSFRYTVPQHVDLVEMTLQTITGHKNSQLHSYWNHLALLRHYVDILGKRWDDLGSVIINNPSKDLMDIVSSYDTIINGTISAWKPPPSKEKSELNFDALRWELFTDKLWKLLIYCNTVNDLKFCFHSLFEELVASGFSLTAKDFPAHDKSYILKIIIETSNGRVAVPTLSAAQALSCLIELGVEKLKRDYFYILDYYNCLSQDQAVQYWESTVRQDKAAAATIDPKSTSRTTVGKVRFTVDPTTAILNLPNILDKYKCLVSMHVACDVLVLALKASSIQSSLANEIRSCLLNGGMNVNVSSNALFEVKVKLDNDAFKNIELSHPVAWNIKFSSKNKRDTVETIFHQTTKKLFSPGVFEYLETPNDAGDGGIYYYVTRLVHYLKELL